MSEATSECVLQSQALLQCWILLFIYGLLESRTSSLSIKRRAPNADMQGHRIRDVEY